MPHTYKLQLTPNQRFNLLPLFTPAQEQLTGSAEGKLFRRTFKALGLLSISAEADANNGQLSSAQAMNRTPASFDVPIECAEYVTDKVAPGKRSHATELLLGDFFDTCADIAKQGTSYEAPVSDCAEYDAGTESWAAPPLDPKGELIAAMAVMSAVPLKDRQAVWKNLSEKHTAKKLQGILDELVDELRDSIKGD